MAIQINLPDKRFTGGGFNLAIYNWLNLCINILYFK